MKKIIKNILLNCSYHLSGLRIPRATKMTATATTIDLESIRVKFETCKYNLAELRDIFSLDHEGAYVDPEAPNQDIINYYEHINNTDKDTGNVLTPKLKEARFSGWSLSVRKLPINYFISREALEEMMVTKKFRETPNKYCIEASKMSIREIMSSFYVPCSCDMDYYLANKSELEADLGRKIDLNASLNELEMKRLEQELFYVNMCKIFGAGGNEDDRVEPDGKELLFDKSYMLSDFHVIFFDGNEMHGTAIRDKNYFLFFSLL